MGNHRRCLKDRCSQSVPLDTDLARKDGVCRKTHSEEFWKPHCGAAMNRVALHFSLVMKDRDLLTISKVSRDVPPESARGTQRWAGKPLAALFTC